SSVILITAQRLARRLCTCKQTTTIPDEALIEAGFTEDDLDVTWLPYKPVGCERCNGSGYKGRVGIYQIMPITEEIERLILNHATALEIEAQARKEGVKNLREAGMVKVKQGLTSLEEVLGCTSNEKRGRGMATSVRKAGSAAIAQESVFAWEGRDKTGKVVRGELRAGGEAVVNATLRRQGVV